MWPELFTLFRELYESFALFAFVEFVLAWLGGFDRVVKAFMLMNQKPQHVWVSCFPNGVAKIQRKWCREAVEADCLVRPFGQGGHLIRGILFGMLQYTLVSVVISVVLITLWTYLFYGVTIYDFTVEECMKGLQGHPHDLKLATNSVLCHRTRVGIPHWTFESEGTQYVGAADLYKAWESKLVFVKGASLGYALYCTFLMLKETERNIHLEAKFDEIKPEWKFWGIKALIGLTMFQKMLCEKVLPNRFVTTYLFDILPKELGRESFTPDQVGIAIQNLALCFELLFAAFAHLWVFPVTEHGEPMFAYRWYDGTFVQMCRWRDHERDFKRKLTELRSSGGADVLTMKRGLEEHFKYFHPDGEAKFNPIYISSRC